MLFLRRCLGGCCGCARRGQAALEFLLTYGWAILVVLVVISAMAYFGVLSPSNLLPEKCTFQASFSCKDSEAGQNGVQIVLQNSAGKDIRVTSVTFSSDALNSLNGVCSTGAISAVVKNSQQAAFYATDPLNCAFKETGRAKNKYVANITYQFSDSAIPHIVSGELVARAGSGAISVGGGGGGGSYGGGSGDASLAGYWRFDEGSGTTVTDSSGKGNTGTLSGGGNLVQNSGFELGSTLWTLWSGAIISTERAHSGTSSLKITGAQQENYQIVNVNPLTTYTIAAWVYVDYTPPAGLRIDAQELPTGPFDVNYAFTSVTGKWMFLSKTFTTGPTTNQIRIRLINDNPGSVGNGYFDDVQLTTGPVWGEGKFGNGLNFDGVNDYASVLHHSSLDAPTQYTISAWVKGTFVKPTIGDNEWNNIAVKLTPDNYGLWINKNRYLHHCTVIAGIRQCINSASGIVSQSQWVHVVATFDGNFMRTYLNGNKVAEGNFPGSLSTNTNPLEIGRTGSGWAHMNGTIDEVKIWNRALSAQEIATLAAQ